MQTCWRCNDEIVDALRVEQFLESSVGRERRFITLGNNADIMVKLGEDSGMASANRSIPDYSNVHELY
jgi:hypothetical protein